MTDTPEVDFFFDVGSPYSYLASTQLPGLRERTGARVRWRPFLLGGAFALTGNDMPARVSAKARYMLTDLERWAARYGVPFRMSSHFPVNTLHAQRLLLAAEEAGGAEAIERLAAAFFEGLWADDEDLSAPDVLAARVRAAGLDADALAARIAEPDLKQKLKDVTAEAVERGAFGAPTFFAGDAMFFGNDRMDMLEDHLRGPGEPSP
ncbi:MAG TPA: 2-hydroxychromene-2-carboxylate isomerase [Sandaracinaceae bacterium LLY-WYZ-13_1]|nr:2-hydroxychromene-2-carboxylate isomerase [Sandaracinaceae bacterium LLY-WYZ-13_1]